MDILRSFFYIIPVSFGTILETDLRFKEAVSKDFQPMKLFTRKPIFSTGDVSFPRFRILLISKLPCIPGWLHNEQYKYGGGGPWMRALNGGAMNAGGHEPVGPEFDPRWYQRLRQFLSSKTKNRTRAPQIMRRALNHCAMMTCIKL